MPLATPYKFFDPPQVLNAVITSIPASSNPPLQVIADSGIDLGIGVQYTDTTGDFIGVYTGAVGQEVLACIIGNGISSIAWAFIQPRSRISLRSMVNTAITSGSLSGVLLKG